MAKSLVNSKFVNDIVQEQGAELILENGIRTVSGFSNWKDGTKPGRWNQKTNQEESRYRIRNATQSRNIWLSSKPRNHLELQLVKSFKGSQQYGS